MKRIVLLLAAVAALMLAGTAQAQTMYACWGEPNGYVAQFDGARGQLVDGNVRYPEKRVYLEWQSWLTPVGVETGHNSEHIHIGACVPQGETWLSPNDDRYLDIEFTFHNVLDYEATAIHGSFVSKTGSRGAFDSAETFAPLVDINTAMNTSGHLGAEKAYASLKVRPSTNNGIKEMRWGLTLVEDGPGALVPRWRLDARWYVTDSYAELPDSDAIDEHVRYIRLRSIIDFVQDGVLKKDSYHHSGWADSWAWDRDDFEPRRPATWNVDLRVTDGGGPAALEINPNHHVHPDSRGAWFTDFTMFTPSPPPDPSIQFRTETVPLGTLDLARNPVHRLVFLSHDEPDCIRLNRECPADVRPVWTNVNVLPFKVP